MKYKKVFFNKNTVFTDKSGKEVHVKKGSIGDILHIDAIDERLYFFVEINYFVVYCSFTDVEFIHSVPEYESAWDGCVTCKFWRSFNNETGLGKCALHDIICDLLYVCEEFEIKEE